MSEVDEFIADMADSVAYIKATDRQKEVFKASLRYAISHARRKADERKKAPWPAGCHDPDSCSRHKACMYIRCRNEGRSIAGEVETAITLQDGKQP